MIKKNIKYIFMYIEMLFYFICISCMFLNVLLFSKTFCYKNKILFLKNLYIKETMYFS